MIDLSILDGSNSYIQQIADIFKENQQAWEPWMESAESYDHLKRKLIARGFKAAPMSGKLLFNEPCSIKEHKIKTLPNQKVMLRRNAN